MKRSLYPKIIEKGKCRGCGKPVPKGRQTWCSNLCYATRCPAMVKMAVRARDKGVCAICGIDTERAEARMPHPHRGMPVVNIYHPRFRENGFSNPFNHKRYELAQSIRIKHEKQWREAAAKRREHFIKLGFPYWETGHWCEADHIIPHSEGGEYTLENMRTLCVPCHKKRTREWHKLRKQKAEQPTLQLT